MTVVTSEYVAGYRVRESRGRAIGAVVLEPAI